MSNETGSSQAPTRSREGSKRLYCSGYWPISGNTKRSQEHYAAYLPATLDIIHGQELVFYSNDNSYIERVHKLAEERGITFTGSFMEDSELPARDLAVQMVDACRGMNLDKFAKSSDLGSEKGVIHYWRDFVGSGEPVYRKLLSIWLSKVFLTSALAQGVETDRLTAWMDISVSRFQGRRENSGFQNLVLPADRLSHYGSAMRFYGVRLPLNASFLCGTGPVWSAVEEEFSDATNRATTMPYGHDEETVLADCVRRKPELFYCIGLPQTRIQRYLWAVRRGFR